MIRTLVAFASFLSSSEPTVTWIKVEKPSFDLVGVVLGSFRLAGFLLALALGLGLLLGAALLRARRRPRPSPLEAVSLHLGPHEAHAASGDLGRPASPAGA